MAGTSARLSAEAWLDAGMRALAETGPEALKAEPLARALGTTKGSFYWHFKDVEDYRSQLAERWKAISLEFLERIASATSDPTARLHQIAHTISDDEEDERSGKAETAFRAWAKSDHTAANAIAEIDAARLQLVGTTLSSLGLTNPDFARLVCGAHLGMAFLPGTPAQNDSALSTLTAALLALQEA